VSFVRFARPATDHILKLVKHQKYPANVSGNISSRDIAASSIEICSHQYSNITTY
jgi:hypothetical protein